MKAFVVKFEQLFKMDTGQQGRLVNFCQDKRKMIIPLYHPVAKKKKEKQMEQYNRIWEFI